eukprot:3011787-Pyramimonas_sp.AAC.1
MRKTRPTATCRRGPCRPNGGATCAPHSAGSHSRSPRWARSPGESCGYGKQTWPGCAGRSTVITVSIISITIVITVASITII